MRVVSFGSVNLDLAIQVPHLAAPDETVLARAVTEHVGGKGLNQAVAAARLGAEASMVGLVGGDAYGARLLEGLERNGVDHRHVGRAGLASGLALCHVADDGSSAIVVVPGANALVTAADAERAAADLAAADVLLLQGEVPAPASCRAAELARRGGALVVVNPAPAVAGPAVERLLGLASLVVVNAVEAATLGLGTGGGERPVVVTLGAEGAVADGRLVPPVPAPEVVDPTGAGDAFVAALATALAEGRSLVDAARWACAAGSAAVRIAGAEPSFPDRARLEELLDGAS
jgi:ribokinase